MQWPHEVAPIVTGQTAAAPGLALRGDIDADATVPSGMATVALAVAGRFRDGATLWSYAPGHDDHARHVAVEFLHPAVLGAQALAAAAIAGADPAPSRSLLCRPGDVLLEMTADATPAPVVHPWTVRLRTRDPLGWYDGRVVRSYHLLWELVQVCLQRTPGAGASAAGDPTAFLYPFLDAPDGATGDDTALLDDLDASAASKVAESHEVIAEAHRRLGPEIGRAGSAIADRLAAGGRLFTVGNGGSAADAGVFATLCLAPPSGRPLVARSLASDAVVGSALANDLGAEHMYSRQVGAQATSRDVLVAFSTSGDSRNVAAATTEANRRGALSVALLGYDGGALAASGGVDHCLVVPSQSVHRIQEAQASLSVSLWRRIQDGGT